MMDLWPENQGHLPQYIKYGTLPRRNCTQNYTDRYQGIQHPLYYSEQQDQGRESSYWTTPGSRPARSLQDYTNWNDPELASVTTSHFPFILDRHSRQHQELREYQHQEARDREWTAIQRAGRDYDRGMTREGWQRRWEPVSPVHYNRDVSKRNDNSYRELEAWAARYSHSLPRRRRIEAELRGASQGLSDKSRADPRVAELPQIRPPTNIREPGLWDRGSRPQVPNYNLPSASAPETSRSLDVKEKMSYQRKMFSHPPGYIAPPPYYTSRSSQTTHHYDTSWEQELKRQIYQFQPQMQDFSKDLRNTRKTEIDAFTKPDLEGYKQRKDVDISSSAVRPECVLSLQQTPDAKTNEETYSKIIEGRKFRLNKKTGGMTIFCLVSRIARAETDTPCLPLCTTQTNSHSTEAEEVSQRRDGTDISQTLKLPDEVDFRSQEQTSVQQSPQAKQKEFPVCDQSLVGDVLNRADAHVVKRQKSHETNSMVGRQADHSLPSAPVKYPLWREPNFTSRAETDSSILNTDSDCSVKQENPSDADEGQRDAETESKDGNPKLLIDTTCVVVKMELIPSPKKEHVHYVSSDEHNPFNVQTDVSPESVQLNQDLTQNVDTATEANPLEVHQDKKYESGMSFLSSLLSSPSEKETLEERAQRILGIALDKDLTDSSEKSHEKAVAPSTENLDMNKDTQQFSQEASDNEVSHKQLDDGFYSRERNDAKDQVTYEGEGGSAGSQDQVTGFSLQSTTEFHQDFQNTHQSQTADDPVSESSGEETSEDLLDDNERLHPLTDITHPFSPFTDCKDADSALPSSDLPSSSDTSESNIQERPDPDLQSRHSEAQLLPTTPSPVPSESAEHFKSLDPDADEPLRPPLSLTVPTTEDHSYLEGQDTQDRQITQVVNNGLLDTEPMTEDVTQQLHSPQQTESAHEEEDVTEHQMKEDNEVPTSPLEPIMENATEINDMMENGLTNHVSCVKECLMAEDESKEWDQTPALDEEDLPDCQREAEILERQVDKSEESTCMDETRSADGFHEEAEEDPSDIIEEPELKDKEKLHHPPEFDHSEQDAFVNDARESLKEDTDEDLSGTEQTVNQCQTETETDTSSEQNEFEAAFVNETHSCEGADEVLLEHTDLTENTHHTETEATPAHPSSPLPTNSNHLAHQSPSDILPPSQVTFPTPVTHSTDPKFDVEDDSAGSSALHLIPETFPPHLHLDSCQQPRQCPSPFASDSPPALEVHESATFNPPSAEQKEMPRYPKSLWDAVNRIRKHTAPDSENEEEEVADTWDPDVNSLDGLSYYNGGDQEGKNPTCEEEEQQVLLHVEDVQNEKHPVHEEPCGHVEDTPSCNSNSSHDFDNTIKVGEEGQDVEAETVSKMNIDKETDKKYEAGREPTEDKDGGRRSKSESHLTEEPVEVMETAQRGEDEG